MIVAGFACEQGKTLKTRLLFLGTMVKLLFLFFSFKQESSFGIAVVAFYGVMAI